jgi:hypothetical protein
MFHRQSPNFMAFFPASSSFPGMLGELYSAAFTAPAFNWICSPAITELETVVLDWLAKLFNLPDCYLSTTHGGGVIQGSASEAVVVAVVAARDKYLRETTSHLSGLDLEDAIAIKRSKLVALGSESSHSSTQKAAQIAGVRYRSVPVTREDGFAMKSEALEEVLKHFDFRDDSNMRCGRFRFYCFRAVKVCASERAWRDLGTCGCRVCWRSFGLSRISTLDSILRTLSLLQYEHAQVASYKLRRLVSLREKEKRSD